jgi:type VI secretion system protein ImpA
MLAQTSTDGLRAGNKNGGGTRLVMGATESGQLLSRAQAAGSCGPNLEYDPKFLGVQAAASPRREQQFGSVVIRSPPPDWNEVYRHAIELFTLSLDLRVAVILLRATLRVHGWVELAPALKVVSALLEHQWLGVHPLPDDDAPGDHFTRANALRALADPRTVLADLCESTPWGGKGPTVQDVLQAWDAAFDDTVGYLAVEEVCREVRQLELVPGGIDALDEVNDAAMEIDRIIKSRFASPPDLTPLLRITRVLAQLPAIARGEARPQPRECDERLTATMSPLRRDEALPELRSVAEWLNAKGLTDRVPALMRQAERLQMQNFAKMLDDVLPKAGDPLAPAAEPIEESSE